MRAFITDCWKGIRPIVNAQRLAFLKGKFSTLNPLCPADQFRAHLLTINELERSDV